MLLDAENIFEKIYIHLLFLKKKIPLNLRLEGNFLHHLIKSIFENLTANVHEGETPNAFILRSETRPSTY